MLTARRAAASNRPAPARARLGVQSVPAPRRVATGPRDAAMRLARTCYDHLAGRFGALLCTHCLQRGWLLRKAGSRAPEVTPAGAVTLRDWLEVRRWETLHS